MLPYSYSVCKELNHIEKRMYTYRMKYGLKRYRLDKDGPICVDLNLMYENRDIESIMFSRYSTSISCNIDTFSNLIDICSKNTVEYILSRIIKGENMNYI